MTQYHEFVSRKLFRQPPTGMECVPELSDHLFPHQRDLVHWALRRGRSAIFADTGLGKTRMEIEWAHRVAADQGRPVLILAPLAVASQTVAEGERMGVEVIELREPSPFGMIHITNYERIHKFDPRQYAGIVLDESSIIKHHDAKTFAQLTEAFGGHAWKLCATATPAPNDHTELGTHAEFLGVCSRQEMLSEFFTHDGGETQKWRLKGHARELFWEWVATWGALVQKPSDLGYCDEGYLLPLLTVTQHEIAVETDAVLAEGRLFATIASGLMERRQARRESMPARVAAVAEMVNADNQPWVVWCELNAESEALARAIPDAVEVRGSQSIDDKESRLRSFGAGNSRVIITKPSIAGFGLNWQHCARVAFVGVNDSWESYYQAVRRCWRFGQHRPVDVHVFASEAEGQVVANLKRKESEAAEMSAQLSAMTRDSVLANVLGSRRDTNAYSPITNMEIPAWLRPS
jgi:hypothetical protein